MEDDLLKSLLRQKLEGYEAPTIDSDWDGISHHLQRRKLHRTTVRWIAAGGAIAASIAIFLLLQYDPLLPNDNAQQIAVVSDLEGAITPPSAKIDEEILKPTIKPLPLTQNVRLAGKSPSDNTKKDPPVTVDLDEKNITLADAVTIQNDIEREVPQGEKTVTEQKREASQNFFDPFLIDDRQPSSYSRDKWGFAVLASQTGATVAKEYDIPTPRYAMRNTAPVRNTAISPEETGFASVASKKIPANPTETIHHIPLSFGATFRYYFLPRWAVESGLVYTYLASEYRYDDNSRIDQKMHYLGLPLNIVYQFVGNRYFSLYLSGGGMMEKGLRADYTKTGPSIEKTQDHESIDGLQWSLNAQLGASYNFTRRFSLYAEPGIRWFAPDQNQPRSIRTDQSFNFSIGVGLRTVF